MNQEIKAKWVEALRSGKYKQTQAKLFDEETGGYCCLGVLCQIYDEVNAKSRTWNPSGGVVPLHVMKWSGLQGPLPSIKNSPNSYTGLHFLNDILGWNFSQIASAIEDSQL